MNAEMNELLEQLKTFNPQPIEDSDFEPVKGAYKAKVSGISRKTGEKDGRAYDFYSFNTQVLETLEGDRADNRYLSKTYNMITSEFTTPDGEMKRLITDLFTCGISYDLSSPEAFDVSLSAAVDKEVYIRAWVRTSKDDKDKHYQSFKFVKELKLRGEKSTGKSPF